MWHQRAEEPRRREIADQLKASRRLLNHKGMREKKRDFSLYPPAG